MIKFLFSQLKEPWLVAKYIISGLIAAGVQVGSLAILVEKAHFGHIFAVPFAFALSAIVAFFLQKFWTFGHRSFDGVQSQAFLYVILIFVALLLNIALMYVFVDLLRIWYIAAQIITIALVTIITFLSNKYLVFKHISPKATEDMPTQF